MESGRKQKMEETGNVEVKLLGGLLIQVLHGQQSTSPERDRVERTYLCL